MRQLSCSVILVVVVLMSVGLAGFALTPSVSSNKRPTPIVNSPNVTISGYVRISGTSAGIYGAKVSLASGQPQTWTLTTTADTYTAMTGDTACIGVQVNSCDSNTNYGTATRVSISYISFSNCGTP